MRLDAEGHESLLNPSWDQIEAILTTINPRAHSFFTLSDPGGSYVQAAGARLRLTIEYRDARSTPFQHYVLGDARPPGSLTSLNYSGGALAVFQNEILSIGSAQAAFREFYQARSIPSCFALRDDTGRHAPT